MRAISRESCPMTDEKKPTESRGALDDETSGKQAVRGLEHENESAVAASDGPADEPEQADDREPALDEKTRQRGDESPGSTVPSARPARAGSVATIPGAPRVPVGPAFREPVSAADALSRGLATPDDRSPVFEPGGALGPADGEREPVRPRPGIVALEGEAVRARRPVCPKCGLDRLVGCDCARIERELPERVHTISASKLAELERAHESHSRNALEERKNDPPERYHARCEHTPARFDRSPPEPIKVASLRWEGSNLVVEDDRGRTWAFSNVAVASMKLDPGEAENVLDVEEVPVEFAPLRIVEPVEAPKTNTSKPIPLTEFAINALRKLVDGPRERNEFEDEIITDYGGPFRGGRLAECMQTVELLGLVEVTGVDVDGRARYGYALTEAGRARLGLVEEVNTGQPDDEAVVAGDALTISLDEFKDRAVLLIYEEQRRSNPDNATIGFLCECVRLAREYEKAKRL